MDAFRKTVYETVAKIPAGRVANYGAVARLAGRPRAARQVGRYLHCNPDPTNIPCHRVVFADGSLAPAYAFGGEAVQRALLEREGVSFTPDGKVAPECFI